MRRHFKTIAAPASLAALLLQCCAAFAQDDTATAHASPVATVDPTGNADERTQPQMTGWNVAAGGGIAVRPTYAGSDRYVASPLPFIRATYHDMISLGANGLSVYWHRDRVRIGIGLAYSGGRNNTRSSTFHQGDDRLKSLGNIGSTAGIRTFASYNAGDLALDGSITRFMGSDNDGLLVNVGVSLPYRLNDRTALRAHVDTIWADQNYMQTFFGVSPNQAASSDFSQFNAGSGFMDVSVGINTNYRLDERWFLDANADVKKLTGDAAKSPVSFSNIQKMLMVVVGYHF